MKKYFAFLLPMMVVMVQGCTNNDSNNNCTVEVVEITTDINTPTTWDACHVYVIAVNQISVNSTLTIQEGAIIKFKEIASDNAILVSNAGRIIAEGTAARPVVFTSYKDDDNGGDTNGDGSASSPAQFDWGGIIINSNNCTFRYCHFLFGGEGPGGGAGQPTLEFSFYRGIIDECTFAYCGGETNYAGYGVVDAVSCEDNSFSITNCTFYGNVKPLRLNSFINLDNSNSFHNPGNTAEGNQLNGVFIAPSGNEATTNVSWTETEVPFVLTGSLSVGDGLKLIVASNVIIKVATLPSIGFNRIDIREGSSQIEGHDLPGVFFTSYLDDTHGGDTNGDGSASAAGTGDWYGVLDLSATIPTNNHCYDWSNVLNAQYP